MTVEVTNANCVEVLTKLRDYFAIGNFDQSICDRVAAYKAINHICNEIVYGITKAKDEPSEAEVVVTKKEKKLSNGHDTTNYEGKWHNLDTIPREDMVEIKTATGLIRKGYVRDDTEFNRKGRLQANTNGHGTCSAAYWRPIND